MQRNRAHLSSRGAFVGAALLLAALLAPAAARADWPMARHDARRTGMAPGKSNIKQPKVRWSSYLGGTLRADALLAYDIDGDGRAEIIHSTGGAVAAKRPDDTVIWRTRVYGLGLLLGVADFDGDGKQELLVYTPHNAYLLDVTTGKVVWAQPDGEMGVIAGYARMVPRAGGKYTDVILPECGGCGGSKDKQSGFVYSFTQGFGNPTRVKIPMEVGVTPVLTVADLDGAGKLAILINDDDKPQSPPSLSKVNLLDETTGASLLPAAFDIHESTVSVTCVPGDIDGFPGEELVCVASPGQAGDRIFALKWNGVSLSQLWSIVANPGEVFNNVFTNPLVDLDGDGKPEVAVSLSHADGTYSTRVYSPLGALLASYAGLRYLGTAVLDPSGKPTVIANNATEMGGLSFDGKALKLLFTIPDQRPNLEPDRQRAQRSSAAVQKVVVTDLTGDAIPDLVTWKLTGDPMISGYTIKGGAAVLLTSVGFNDQQSPFLLWALPPVDRAFPQLATAETDGVLRTRDMQLQPTSTEIRFGGYYAPGDWGQLGQTGVIASLDGGPAQQILFTDSKGSLRRIDAASASLDAPPIKHWEVRGLSHPIVVPGIDGGKPGIVAFGHLPPPSTDRTVRVLRVDSGETVWEVPIPEAPINDLVAAKLTLGDTPDLLFQTADPTQPTLVRTRAISGEDGASLWSFSEKPGNCGLQPAGISVADWNGDGYDDVLQQADVTRANSGIDGSSLVAGKVGGCYFLPAIVDPDQDGQDNVILQGGFQSINMLTHDLSQQVFASTDGDRPYPYGALAECPAGQVWVEGSWQFPSRLKITSLSGPQIGAATTMFLASGAKYADEEAVLAAHAGQGQLTAVSMHANLAGDGAPVAVVGSGDGFLYGVDPCGGDLRFALDFAYSVGEPLFGDTDGDGLDEIIVSVADGNLYALVDDPAKGTGGNGTGGRESDWPLLYGRADCYCQAPDGAVEGAFPMTLLAFGASIALGRRKRRTGSRARLSPWQK
ncbi:MAG: hypothetical protein ABI193_08945 [Minicystis sp.]